MKVISLTLTAKDDELAEEPGTEEAAATAEPAETTEE
jgi:hypothetical protein